MRQAKLNKSLMCLAFIAGTATAPQVGATTYTYDILNPPGSDAAGNVASFSTSYDDVTQQLTWSSTIEEVGGNLANGFWLVLSDGPNPKNHVNEYAIFYGDATSGNITSYVYNGVNSSNSWFTPGEFIQSFAGGLSVDNSVAGERTMSFSLDVSGINGYVPMNGDPNDWDGAAFANKIGIWYHPALLGTGASYNPDGSLSSFQVAKGGWYDTSNQMTTVVPVPAAVWLFGSGLIGLIGVSRRRA